MSSFDEKAESIYHEIVKKLEAKAEKLKEDSLNRLNEIKRKILK